MKTRRIIFAIVALAMIVSMFAVSAFATKEEFSTKVAGIDTTKNYAERNTYLNDCLALYKGLTADEQTAVKKDYEKVVAEGDAIKALLAKAEEFIAAVNVIKNALTLADKENALNNLIDSNKVINDTTITGVEEALADLNKLEVNIKKSVQACYDFMAIVDEMSLSEDYLEIKALKVRGEKVILDVDSTYPGVQDAKNRYNKIISEVGEKEYYTRDVIKTIESIADVKDYKYKQEIYRAVQNNLTNDSFLPDYDGVAEAMETLKEVEEYFKECKKKGITFIRAVDGISDAETMGRGLIDALAAFKGVDKTVEGVSAAKASLDDQVRSYNALVKSVNALQYGL